MEFIMKYNIREKFYGQVIVKLQKYKERGHYFFNEIESVA